ncbi:MAG: hypothetical protein N3E37_01345 [Candidatus Micrarchaeota archaeon]|nr:hypothetical protein [Candidatus Micrarchaeota archaeon]
MTTSQTTVNQENKPQIQHPFSRSVVVLIAKNVHDFLKFLNSDKNSRPGNKLKIV